MNYGNAVMDPVSWAYLLVYFGLGLSSILF